MTLNYKIYSHFDFDGAVAALLLKAKLIDHMAKNFPSEKELLQVQIKPVDHANHRSVGSVSGWAVTPICGPCAVLDFSLHPLMLLEKFYDATDSKSIRWGLHSYWIDHHETGAAFAFLTQENLHSMVPGRLKAVWDPSALSTPGLMRTHRKQLELADEIVLRFEKLIDLCEVADGARFLSAEDATDLSNVAVQLQTLFASHHPLIHREKLYCSLIDHLLEIADGQFHRFVNFDPVYGLILEYEAKQNSVKKFSYECVLKVIGKETKVALADFRKAKELWHGIGRFIPYLLAPDCTYAIHISPANSQGECSITCGRNPWLSDLESDEWENAPRLAPKVPVNLAADCEEHFPQSGRHVPLYLGKLFARMFSGGGHSVVAGGTLRENETKALEELIALLCVSK